MLSKMLLGLTEVRGTGKDIEGINDAVGAGVIGTVNSVFAAGGSTPGVVVINPPASRFGVGICGCGTGSRALSAARSEL